MSIAAAVAALVVGSWALQSYDYVKERLRDCIQRWFHGQLWQAWADTAGPLGLISVVEKRVWRFPGRNVIT